MFCVIFHGIVAINADKDNKTIHVRDITQGCRA